jgi:SNF2 family DNA or RNA helicase
LISVSRLDAGSATTAQPPADAESDSAQSSLWSALHLAPEQLLRDPGPLVWPKPLLDYQLVGAHELVRRPTLLLADDMGLGKTIQAIAALRALIVAKQVSRALLVVPAGLLRQWRAELRLWAPELRVSTVHGVARDRDWQWRTPAHVYLTSYETLRSDFSTHPGAPVARDWDLVILDEAQKIKNPLADVSRVCKQLTRKRQWALTGTPLENSTDDLVSILDFVAREAAQELHGFNSLANLKRELARVQLRRRKADVLLDLPPKTITHVAIPLAPRQRATYERAEREGIIELRERGASIRIENVLELIVRLKQICNVCPTSGESSKLADLSERVLTLAAEGQKALIFSQFANAENGARAIAARLPVPALTYTGDQSQQERERVLETFRSDPRQQALVLSLRAGGQGLNLQQASYVFHFDRWWNPATEAQAESRSHRMGQQYPVHVYAYTCEETIEERIDAVLREKQLLFDELVDGVSLDLSRKLTHAELFGLFGLQPPAGTGRDAARAVPPARDVSPDEFIHSAEAALTDLGWQLESRQSDASVTELRATRIDDLGVTITLQARCLLSVSPAQLADVDALRDELRGQQGVVGALVARAGFSVDARQAAREHGIVTWDARRLSEMRGT